MNDNLRNIFRIITVTVATTLIVVVAVLVIVSTERVEAAASLKAQIKSQDNRGTSYIISREAVSVAAIEEKIFEEETKAIREMRRQEFLSDPSLIFETLKSSNTILAGESRTAGFSAYGFLDDNHVLGGIGWSIQEIPALYGQIEALAPSNLVFSFGINELGRFSDTPVYYYTPELFTADLEQYIRAIQEQNPGIRIYINCIVPCTEDVYRQYPGFAVIPEWNDCLKEFCEQKGYGFIDISDLCAEHVGMYREDGIHLISDFYPYWGARILEEVLPDE